MWTYRPSRTYLGWAHFAKSNSLPPGPTTNPPYAIIIGVSFGGLFVLVLCIIFLVRFCKNRNAAHRGKRGSYNMPPDRAFPDSQSMSWSQSLWTTLTLVMGNLVSAAISKQLNSQMKDFTDTTMAFSAAKGAFVLVLVNQHSVFSEILISQSELVDCGNMVRDQSLDCKNLRKPNAFLRNWYRKNWIFWLNITCRSWDKTR